jgi:hypothetical protein
MKNIPANVVDRNKNTNFMFNNVFLKSCPLREEVENYGRTKQTTDDSISYAEKCNLPAE